MINLYDHQCTQIPRGERFNCFVENFINRCRRKDIGLKHFFGAWQHSPFPILSPYIQIHPLKSRDISRHQRCQVVYIYSNASPCKTKPCCLFSLRYIWGNQNTIWRVGCSGSAAPVLARQLCSTFLVIYHPSFSPTCSSVSIYHFIYCHYCAITWHS